MELLNFLHVRALEKEAANAWYVNVSTHVQTNDTLKKKGRKRKNQCLEPNRSRRHTERFSDGSLQMEVELK